MTNGHYGKSPESDGKMLVVPSGRTDWQRYNIKVPGDDIINTTLKLTAGLTALAELCSSGQETSAGLPKEHRCEHYDITGMSQAMLRGTIGSPKN
jgi:hypothetical protein